MPSCPVCGGVNFEKHAGFLYCSECQTQSQDYHEEEYEFRQHDSAIRTAKSSKSRSVKGEIDEACGTWTSWELFNHMLYGMTQELKPICKKKSFESTVLSIWACYLNRLEAGFITNQNVDAIPKLGINFKERDAKIIYNVAARSIASSRVKKKKLVKKKRPRSVSNMSQSSIGSGESKRSRSRKRMKIVNKEYEESISRLSGETSTLANETLESLGQSSDESCYMSDVEPKLSAKARREILSKDAKRFYKKYKDTNGVTRPDYCVFPSKPKLLAIIQLALIVIESDIQLSDLLRFVREGHLSFAKSTHFLPEEIKIPRRKESKLYITDVDKRMPCHMTQRRFVIHIAKLLDFKQFPHPNMEALISRYCKELKLPDQVVIYSIRIVRLFLNNYRRKLLTEVKGALLTNAEGLAMGCIVIVLKFYFGLDDKIEKILSGFAKTVNNLKNGTNNLFVFEDWQKYIECRKMILRDFHYPTQERYESDHYSTRKFIDTLVKESKDEFISERFYGESSLNTKLLKGIQDITSNLADTKLTTLMEFPPSLTPQESYINILKKKVANKELDFSTAIGYSGQYEKNDFPWDILNQKFKHCDITFTRNPQDSIKLLEENNFKVVELSKSDLLNNRDIDINHYKSNNEVLFVIVDNSYWVNEYTNFWITKNYETFKEDFFDNFSSNFQWVLVECARVIENTVRDLYMEIYRIEMKLFANFKPDINILKRK